MRTLASLLLRMALPVLLLGGLSIIPAPAQDLTISVDVPSLLGGSYYLPTDIVGRGPAGYHNVFDGRSAGLGPESGIDALAILQDGSMLFSVDVPTSLGPLAIGPSDIVRVTAAGSGASIVLSAAAMGLSDTANIDALATTPAGDLIVSFNAPTSAGAATFLPADLVRASAAGLAPYVSGASMGLGPEVNVTGVDVLAPNNLYLSFAAPLSVGTTTFMPGEIVHYAAGTLTSFFKDPAIPQESALADFSLPASPGAVPDGGTIAGVPLMVDRVAGSPDIRMTWSAGCGPAVTDYAVYEGSIGSWYSHVPRTCSTGGATNATLTPGTGNRYYLVAPTNSVLEGSYGTSSSGAQIPPGAGACHPQRVSVPTCP